MLGTVNNIKKTLEPVSTYSLHQCRFRYVCSSIKIKATQGRRFIIYGYKSYQSLLLPLHKWVLLHGLTAYKIFSSLHNLQLRTWPQPDYHLLLLLIASALLKQTLFDNPRLFLFTFYIYMYQTYAYISKGRSITTNS